MEKTELLACHMERDVLISRLEYCARGGYVAAEEKNDLLRESFAHLRRTPSPGNKPLTLEELREMDGEPVYIRRLEDADGLWIVVRSSERRKLTTDYGGYFEFNDYGKTWLAYRRPPEKGE